jgi:hypothetical protein
MRTVNRRTIKKDALGMIMFVVGVRTVWIDQSNIGLLVGLVLTLFGSVTLMRGPKEASMVAERMLGRVRVPQFDELLAGSPKAEE